MVINAVHLKINKIRVDDREDRVKNKWNNFTKGFHRYKSSFLSLATGIFNCSLYFATVLLAIKYPFSFNKDANFSSVNGLLLSSLFMASFKIVLTSLVETSSPESVVNDSLKKYFKEKIPYGVDTCFELATLETVSYTHLTLPTILLV